MFIYLLFSGAGAPLWFAIISISFLTDNFNWGLLEVKNIYKTENELALTIELLISISFSRWSFCLPLELDWLHQEIAL